MSADGSLQALSASAFHKRYRLVSFQPASLLRTKSGHSVNRADSVVEWLKDAHVLTPWHDTGEPWSVPTSTHSCRMLVSGNEWAPAIRFVWGGAVDWSEGSMCPIYFLHSCDLAALPQVNASGSRGGTDRYGYRRRCYPSEPEEARMMLQRQS